VTPCAFLGVKGSQVQILSARQHDVGSSLLITAGTIWAPAILNQPQCRGVQIAAHHRE
jgi:hypothetical protein